MGAEISELRTISWDSLSSPFKTILNGMEGERAAAPLNFLENKKEKREGYFGISNKIDIRKNIFAT